MDFLYGFFLRKWRVRVENFASEIGIPSLMLTSLTFICTATISFLALKFITINLYNLNYLWDFLWIFCYDIS